jgi:hypothetical protein
LADISLSTSRLDEARKEGDRAVRLALETTLLRVLAALTAPFSLVTAWSLRPFFGFLLTRFLLTTFFTALFADFLLGIDLPLLLASERTTNN